MPHQNGAMACQVEITVTHRHDKSTVRCNKVCNWSECKTTINLLTLHGLLGYDKDVMIEGLNNRDWNKKSESVTTFNLIIYIKENIKPT